MTYQYRATLARVVDGDTVDLNVDLGFHTSQLLRFRLLGIDTPERGQPGFEEAAARVERWFADNGNTCTVKSTKTGKFGRWLGELWAGDCLNDVLLNEGYAVEYKP